MQPVSLDGLDAGLAVLERFHPDRAFTLGEISASLGLSKSRAFRILSTLKRRGFVDQPMRGGPYRLGEKLGMLANTFMLFRALPSIAQPVMEQLSQSVRGTVVLRVPDGCQQLTLACVHSPEVLRTSFPVGALHPMTYGSTGKALLAFARGDNIARLLDQLGEPSDKLRADVRLTRRRGYALNLEETVRGVRGIAAPILDADGHAVAAIGISFPALALSRARIPEVAAKLVSACETIGARCGYAAAGAPAPKRPRPTPGRDR